MGIPASEVGYTSAMPRRKDHKVHKDMWWHWGGSCLLMHWDGTKFHVEEVWELGQFLQYIPPPPPSHPKFWIAVLKIQFSISICSVGFVNHVCFIWMKMLQFCCICGGGDVITPVVQVGPRFTWGCLHFSTNFIHFFCSTLFLHVLLLSKMVCFVHKSFIYL